MQIYLFDATPAQEGAKHGPQGPTHCGTTTVDYEYQVEEWVKEVEEHYLHVVRIECPSIGRQWDRDPAGKFLEVTGASTT